MEKHPDVAKQMEKMHNEDPKKWGKKMRPKWEAAPEKMARLAEAEGSATIAAVASIDQLRRYIELFFQPAIGNRKEKS